MPLCDITKKNVSSVESIEVKGMPGTPKLFISSSVKVLLMLGHTLDEIKKMDEVLLYRIINNKLNEKAVSK